MTSHVLTTNRTITHITNHESSVTKLDRSDRTLTIYLNSDQYFISLFHLFICCV